MEPSKFMYVVTVPVTALAFYVQHLRDLRRRGREVHLVSDPEPADVVRRVVAASGAVFHPVAMRREISPRQDPASLLQMVRTLRRVRPEVLHFTTPKGALLAGLAGVLTGVPLRVYHLMGLRSETAATGPLARLRPLLLATERLTCACAHEVVCVSPSNRDEALALGLVPARKIRVLGSGSPFGLPVKRYAHPDPQSVAQMRERLGLPEGTPVVGFVGRLVTQKGVRELLEAWASVRTRFPEARLLLVGEHEAANPLPADVMRALEAGEGTVRLDAEPDMSRVFPLMTVFTLPSLHEGLGMVILEAAAAGVPTVVTDGAGVRDANLPGVTGLRVPVGDVPALAEAVSSLLADPEWAGRLGRQGQQWVTETFDEQEANDRWADFYRQAWNNREQARRRRQDHLKRALDIAGSAAGLVLLSPVMAGVGLLVAARLGRPVLFRQERPGLGGKPFPLLKFRTMTNAADAQGRLRPDAERLTPFGRWLRSTSLDELPELLNVLRGDMSLVGPRPLLTAYLPLYSAEQARRHEVRPGITGLAQVSGRNALSWEDKFRLDVDYVERRSLGLDLRILWRTLRQVWRREGITFAGGGTEVPFTGTPRSQPQEAV